METRTFHLMYKNKIASEIILAIEGDKAEVHQEVYIWNVNTFLLTRQWLDEIRVVLRDHYDVHQIITASDNTEDKKFRKYLEMMGFTWKLIEKDSNTYIFAETEVF